MIKNIKWTIIILFIFFLGILATYLIHYGLREKFFWSVVSAVFTAVMAIVVAFQAFATKEVAYSTSRPSVSVGLKRENSINKFIISSFSPFTVWVWTKVDLKMDDISTNRITDSYLLGGIPWELGPNEKMIFHHPNLLLTPEEFLEKRIGITIDVFYAITPKQKPRLNDWIRLAPYRYEKETNRWIRSGMGIAYQD